VGSSTLLDALNHTEGYHERATCYACGKRRKCRFYHLGYPFGIGWMICREHPDWLPVKGDDFTVGE
jgi:hypothetical protein